jgi:all-trans-retinol 13,14-reductase
VDLSPSRSRRQHRPLPGRSRRAARLGVPVVPVGEGSDFARRHPGKATIEVIGLAPWAWFAKWQDTRWHTRGDDYEAFKEGLAARLRAVLVERLPAIAPHIVHAELSTPLSTRHFASHPSGEIYGPAHTPARFAARELRPQTALPGLYLTGADICAAGVGGALMGGVLTASAITRRNLLSAIMGDTSAVAPDQKARAAAETFA